MLVQFLDQLAADLRHARPLYWPGSSQAPPEPPEPLVLSREEAAISMARPVLAVDLTVEDVFRQRIVVASRHWQYATEKPHRPALS